MKDSFQLYRRLLGSARPYLKVVVLSILAMIAAASLEPVLPALLKPLVDESLIKKSHTAQWQVPLFLMLAFLAKGVAEYVASVSSQWIANKAITDLRQQVFRHQMHLEGEARYTTHARRRPRPGGVADPGASGGNRRAHAVAHPLRHSAGGRRAVQRLDHRDSRHDGHHRPHRLPDLHRLGADPGDPGHRPHRALADPRGQPQAARLQPRNAGHHRPHDRHGRGNPQRRARDQALRHPRPRRRALRQRLRTAAPANHAHRARVGHQRAAGAGAGRRGRRPRTGSAPANSSPSSPPCRCSSSRSAASPTSTR